MLPVAAAKHAVFGVARPRASRPDAAYWYMLDTGYACGWLDAGLSARPAK